MRKIMSFVAVLATAAVAWGAGHATTTAQKKAPGKSATTAVAKKAPGKSATVARPAAAKGVVAAKKPASRTTTTATRGGKRLPARPTTTWRNRQSTPTSDRYKEIQDALVAKGYLPAEEATGNWGPDSADALKKFQAEQTLELSGKINSLSLIALGLGPKHDSSTTIRTVDGNYPRPESGRN